MDALRWTLLVLAGVVIGGIYAWGRRAAILAWWHGQRGDEPRRLVDESDDLSDELLRLRELMEADKDERPAPRKTGTLRDDMSFAGDFGVEVSAPRPARAKRAEDAERDVLMEAAAAKARDPAPPPVTARAPSSAPSSREAIDWDAADTDPDDLDIQIGSVTRRAATPPPRPSVAPAMPSSPSDSGQPKREVSKPAPSGRPGFSYGAESVSAPRVRKATDLVPPVAPAPACDVTAAPPFAEGSVAEGSVAEGSVAEGSVAEGSVAEGPPTAAAAAVDRAGTDATAMDGDSLRDDDVAERASHVPGAADVAPEIVRAEIEIDAWTGNGVESAAPVVPAATDMKQRPDEPETSVADDRRDPVEPPGPARTETAPDPDPEPGTLSGFVFEPGRRPSRPLPEQRSFDLGDDPGDVEPPPPPASNRPVRRLDTVIVDGEVFDTAKSAPEVPVRPERVAVIPHHPDEPPPPSPGLTEIGGRVLGWLKGVGAAAKERLPKKPEPPVAKTPELILVVHVMAPAGSHFDGAEVRAALTGTKLHLGRNGLYEVLPEHRATTTPVVCVANMLEPGVLTDAELVDLQTPGLTLFAHLPGPVEGVEALEKLLTTAQVLSRFLDGEIRDQSRNKLTKQTIGHLHEQVIDHARRMQIALSRGR